MTAWRYSGARRVFNERANNQDTNNVNIKFENVLIEHTVFTQRFYESKSANTPNFKIVSAYQTECSGGAIRSI